MLAHPTGTLSGTVFRLWLGGNFVPLAGLFPRALPPDPSVQAKGARTGLCRIEIRQGSVRAPHLFSRFFVKIAEQRVQTMPAFEHAAIHSGNAPHALATTQSGLFDDPVKWGFAGAAEY